MDYEEIINLFAAGFGFCAVGILLFMWMITAANDYVSILRVNDFGEGNIELCILIFLFILTGYKFIKTAEGYLHG